MAIFRMYDIRGIAGNEITPEMFVEFGLSVGTYLGGKGLVAIGRDSRTSGDMFMKSLAAGLMATGCNVLTLGIVSTPTIYYATSHLPDVTCGIMITASHNPPQYNGFKLCLKREEHFIQMVSPDDIKAVYDKKNYKRADFRTFGKEQQFDAIKAYGEYLKTHFKFDKPLKVVVDVGNGACGFAVDIIKGFKHKITALNKEPDGLFPNHEPNPILEKNLVQLAQTVKEQKADLGIAFDGDGDRVGFVDNNGKMISSADITMLFAGSILKKNKGAEVVVDVTASRSIEDYVKKAGGKLRMVRVGYPFIQAEIRETGAPFAAEYSGHYYFTKNSGYDDGLYAALTLLTIIAAAKQPISSLVEKLPKYVTSPEKRYELSDATKFEAIEKIKANFKAKKLRVNDTDGARVEFDHGWMLIRASNTEPAVALRFEADSEENLKKIRDTVLPEIDAVMQKAIT
jgi:phosphomannomutase / phosphoglucomutase